MSEDQKHFDPSQPSGWSVVKGGAVPDHARNELVTAGVNPDDPGAVLIHYTSGYYAEKKNQPFWLPEWSLTNMRLKRLP